MSSYLILSDEAFGTLKAKFLTPEGQLVLIKNRSDHTEQGNLEWKAEIGLYLAYELHVRGGEGEQVQIIIREVLNRMIEESNRGRDPICMCGAKNNTASICLLMGFPKLAEEVMTQRCPGNRDYEAPMPQAWNNVPLLRTLVAYRLSMAEVGS